VGERDREGDGEEQSVIEEHVYEMKKDGDDPFGDCMVHGLVYDRACSVIVRE
jgi:hypothetical protein